ncbi:MAG: hypothetical protein M0R03_03960 [Novosphingobium sp.]|nr:hypothetical protein [Novosphingobium sp.]
MSTRAIIKIEGFKVAKVYKHYDGYPEGMIEWLTKFNEEFAKERGDDPSYKFAQLLRHSTRWFPTDGFLGWGVVEYKCSCGEDFEYVLKKDGTVTFKKS